jgi:peptidoglycan/xylan/chitin deacetylase (PgdA/CDA1 family)
MAAWCAWRRIRIQANERDCKRSGSQLPVNPWPVVLPAAAGVAAGIAAWGAVSPSSQLFGPALSHTPRLSAVALTFDDGPNPEVTPKLLALLDRHGIRATFFVVGRFARQCPELLRDLSSRGHVLGNHTETHPNLIFKSAPRIEEELQRCRDSIADALSLSPSCPPMWVRPPFGFRGPQLWGAVRRAGCRGVALWSFTAWDWTPQPASKLIDRLDGIASKMNVARKRPSPSGGEIVLLHDGDFRKIGADRHHTVAALEYWLPRWKDAGIDFVTLDQVGAALPAAR